MAKDLMVLELNELSVTSIWCPKCSLLNFSRNRKSLEGNEDGSLKVGIGIFLCKFDMQSNSWTPARVIDNGISKNSNELWHLGALDFWESDSALVEYDFAGIYISFYIFLSFRTFYLLHNFIYVVYSILVSRMYVKRQCTFICVCIF